MKKLISTPGNNFFVIFLFVFTTILYFTFQKTAIIGSTDISETYLAGTTAILEGKPYPLKQRPPFFSAFLTPIAFLSNLDLSEKVPIAQESGDVIRLEVFQSLLENKFLSIIFIINLSIWLCSLWFYRKTLEELGGSKLIMWVSLILWLAPSSWIMTTQLWEAVILQFLFSVSIFATVKWFKLSYLTKASIGWVLISAVCIGIIGVSRAAFQLLPIFLALLIPFIYPKGTTKSQKFFYPLILVATSLLIIGGWSLRNYKVNGFFGTGGSLGISLSTRTATYLDEYVDPVNEYNELFVSLRDERYVKSDSHSPNLWGEFASRYLIKQNGMTYAQANNILVSYNIKAITQAPLNYLATVFQSFIGFHFPNIPAWSTFIRLLLTPFEFLIIILLFISISIWFSFHLVSRLNPKMICVDWSFLDQTIVFCLMIYIYAVLIHCGIDQGISYQRMSIQYIIILIIVLVIQRFNLGFHINNKTQISNP